MCRQCELKPVYEFTNKRKLCKRCFIRYFQKKVLYTIRKFEMIGKEDVVGYDVSGTHHQVGPEEVGLKEGCIPLWAREPATQAPKNILLNIFTKGAHFARTPKHFSKKMFTRGIVLEDVLKMFAEKAIVELVKLPSNTPRVYPEKSFSKIFTKGRKLDKIAIASTIDLQANEIICTLIQGEAKDLKKLKPVDGRIIKPLYLFLDKEVLLYAKLRKLKFVKNKKEAVRSSLLERQKDKISNFIDELEKKHPEVKRAVVNSYLSLC